jgi:hypothetical protein
MQDHSKDNRDERPSGSRKSSGGLFDAYITRINAMKAANGDGNVTNEEVLAAANEVIAEATTRRAKERARLDEELRQLELAEAIAETDREVEELARQRSEEKINSAKAAAAGGEAGERPVQEAPDAKSDSGAGLLTGSLREKEEAGAGAVPLMLHACRAGFRQPFTGQKIRIEAPLPDWAGAVRKIVSPDPDGAAPGNCGTKE